MNYSLYMLKRKMEDLLIYPFILAGRYRAKRKPLGTSYRYYLFFPFYHTGGAEKVHAQIALALKGRKALIVFTRKSADDGFKALFESSGHVILDISAYTDNKKKYWQNLYWRGVFSQYINNQDGTPVVLNGQCNFAYKLSPWINPAIRQVELIHSFNSFSWIRIPFIPFYNQTVMISRKAIDDHQAQYKSIGVPAYFRERITYIINGIALPVQSPVRDVSRKIITVLYAGRATTEKRVYLVARLAIECRKMGLPVRFEFMGDIREKLPRELQDSGHFHGMVTDLNVIRAIYEQADLLIITSSEEGFPMVIMEAMSMGCAILATPVGDIPAHIRHGQNGYLFTAVQDEQKIIAEGLQYLQDYLAQPETRLLMARSNQAYAKAHFGLDQFRSAWQNVLETQNPITQP